MVVLQASQHTTAWRLFWQEHFWDSLSILYSVHIPLPSTQNSRIKLTPTNSSTFSRMVLPKTCFYNGSYHFMLNFCFMPIVPGQEEVSKEQVLVSLFFFFSSSLHHDWHTENVCKCSVNWIKYKIKCCSFSANHRKWNGLLILLLSGFWQTASSLWQSEAFGKQIFILWLNKYVLTIFYEPSTMHVDKRTLCKDEQIHGCEVQCNHHTNTWLLSVITVTVHDYNAWLL